MVRKTLSVKSAKELNGAQVCMNAGTTTELNLADYFRANNMQYQAGGVREHRTRPSPPTAPGAATSTSTDASGLYAERLKLKNADDHMVLPEIISKEPLGPVVRQGDDQWFDIVRWTLFAMIDAEELGVTPGQRRRDEGVQEPGDPAPARRRGQDRPAARPRPTTGPTRSSSRSAITARCSTAMSAPTTPLGIARGLNALWTDGGLQYALPIR